MPEALPKINRYQPVDNRQASRSRQNIGAGQKPAPT
jgi:hypothetical protein